MALNLIKQIMEEGDPSAASVHRLLYEAEIASPMRAREEIDCPPRLVGRVIGRGGETITNLQIRSGARIFINQDVPENAPRKIILIGTADAVLRGKEMVREVMEYGPPEHNRRNPYLFNVSGQGGPGAGMRGGAAMAGGLGPAAAAQVPGMLPGVQMMQGGVSGMPLGYDVRQAPQMPGMAPGMVYYPMPAFAGDQRAHQGLAALGSMGQAAVSRGDGVGVGGGAPGLGVGMPRGLAAGGAPASPWPQGVVMVPGMLGGAPGSGLAPGVAQQQSPYGVSAQQLSDMMGMMTLSGYAQPGVPQHSAAPTSFGLSGAPGALGSQSERAGEHLAGVAAAPPPASLQAASEALGFSAASTAAPGASDGLRFGAPVSGSGDGASHEYSGVETTDAAASALPPLGLDDNDPAAKTRTSHA
ncbi:unnamed protein product [Pedinophyceae sp. YPF-701]|nr:unnamed protein product [Pedinophyceae sp. YPF-701]